MSERQAAVSDMAERLMKSQKLWAGGPYLHDDAPPTANQIAAVLHALADHTLIETMLATAPELGANRAHLGETWALATGIGRYLQCMGDWCEVFPTTVPTPLEREEIPMTGQDEARGQADG